jgi:hypothetical protein
LLPEQFRGWSTKEEYRVFDRGNIFDYLDGAGEIYLGFNLQHILVRNYARKSDSPIVAEIYKMASSEDAYGIFSQDTDGKRVNIGQGAVYAIGLLRFWKDRFFIRLMAESETDDTKAAVMALGQNIANAISKNGKQPELLTYLPSEGLIKESVRYFHKNVSLNTHYYLADSNLLNLNKRTEAFLARYHMGNHKMYLLIILYANAINAREAYKQFVGIYSKDKPYTHLTVRVEKIEDDEFVSARLFERAVILVLDAEDRASCEILTGNVVQKLGKVF